MRSIGWVGWSTEQDCPVGNAGGSSTPQQRPKVFASEKRAIAYTTGDSAREVFVKEGEDPTVLAFRRLLNPVWMELGYSALGGDPEPSDDACIFGFSGGGGSDFTTYGEFKALMGSPWKALEDNG